MSKIKNLSIKCRFKFLNFDSFFNNSFNKNTNSTVVNHNHRDYVQELESELKTWSYKYKLEGNVFPSTDDFNKASVIFDNAYRKNKEHSAVQGFINIAILYYETLIKQEQKKSLNTSVYERALEEYKKKLASNR